MIPDLMSEFEHRFRQPATLLVRAPGRVNIIGEHTDYNQGFVLPMAIDRCVQIALRPRPDLRVTIHSIQYKETATFQLDTLHPGSGWVEFIKGAGWALQRDGWEPCGWDGILSGDIPLGAGLSSSSALSVAAVLAFAAASNSAAEMLKAHPGKAALLAHQAEDEWVGVHGGIMDQMVSELSCPGHALFLDCRSQATRQIPLGRDLAVAVLDTSTRRGLVDSAYNERRRQCDLAAAALGVAALRDASLELLQSRAASLDGVAIRRARHVISENERVLQAVEAMLAGEHARLGRLLDASHASLRDDFEVSCESLDKMVAIARQQPGCYGARMTGAGFGGCAVAILQKDKAAAFSRAVKQEYENSTGLKPGVYLCQPAAGASVLPLTI